MNAIDIAIAFMLDFCIGDPQWFPHPVRGIGWMIQQLEKITRKRIKNDFVAGAATCAIVVSASFLVVWLTITLLGLWHPIIERVVSILWIYFGLSARDLDKSTRKIYRMLRQDKIKSARKALSMVVGRDTEELDESEISRATVETIAENTIDGIVAPMFFAMLGGAPLMWAFKATSTCDSMIGYQNKRYRRFGTLGARLDDVMNFIPARMSYFLFPFAARIHNYSVRNCSRVAWRDHHNHASPNSGIPEAAMAGALRIQLGGPTVYNGVVHDKKPFGAEFPNPVRKHIPAALRMMWAVAFANLGVIFAVYLIKLIAF